RSEIRADAGVDGHSVRTGAVDSYPDHWLRIGSDVVAADALLMERIRVGDERSFADLMQRYWTPLVSYASRITALSQDEAEDLVQETFVRVWGQRTAWSDRGAVSAYLYRIARNLALNAKLDRKALLNREERGGEEIRDRSVVEDPLEEVQNRVIREDVQRALAAMP